MPSDKTDFYALAWATKAVALMPAIGAACYAVGIMPEDIRRLEQHPRYSVAAGCAIRFIALGLELLKQDAALLPGTDAPAPRAPHRRRESYHLHLVEG